jgi:orotidine-5'-phosphate decarboxylase
MKSDAASGRRTAEDALIVALDVPTREQALDLAQSLQGICRWVKVGLELYLAAGEAVVHHLTTAGFSVFLDLKFHDIPNTVAGAVRSAGSLGASLLTVHASGGREMLAAAAEAAAALPNPPKLLAVTVLTSMDAAQLQATGVEAAPAMQVARLADLAMVSGISGLVCSPQEAATLREQFGPRVFLVTPGIRPAGAATGDQKRAATPAAAITAGADMLVVGRPITAAPSPAAAAQAILAEIREALDNR